MTIQWIVGANVLIVVVLILRALLRGRIGLRLQYALWGLVLLRLLIPVSIGSTALSLMNALEEVPVVREAQLVQDVDTIWYTGEGAVEGLPSGGTGHHQPIVVAEGQTRESYDRMRRAIDLRELLLPLWLAGTAVVLAVFGWANLRFALRLRRSRKPLEVEGCPLRVYVTGAVDTPCLFGIFRPAVYMTPQAAEDPTVLRHAAAHEVTHFRHGDHIWSLLRGVCLAVHWWSPLVWWAAVLSQRDGELACDEGTMARLGESERTEYGRTLIGLTCEKRAALLVAATTMTGSGKSIRERILLLVKRPKTAAAALVVVVLVAAVAVALTFTGAREGEAGGGDPPSSQSPGGSESPDPGVDPDSSITPSPSTDPDLSASPPAVTFTLDRTEFFLTDNWPDPVRIGVVFDTPAAAGDVVWSSSDEGVATVDQTGLVTGVSTGRATITATLPGGEFQTCTVYVSFLVQSEKGPEDPSDIRGVVSASLKWGDGTYTVTNAHDLSRIEAAFAASAPIGYATACPFGAQLTLTLESGESYTLTLAEDSCSVWRVGEAYHEYAMLNEDLFSIFAAEPIHAAAQQGMNYLSESYWLWYLDWGRYYDTVGADATFELIDMLREWVTEPVDEDERFSRQSALMWRTRGLDGAISEAYADLLRSAYEVNKADFAWICVGNLTDAQGAEILSLLNYNLSYFNRAAGEIAEILAWDEDAVLIVLEGSTTPYSFILDDFPQAAELAVGDFVEIGYVVSPISAYVPGNALEKIR